MNTPQPHDAVETALALEAHNAETAYTHMLTREQARAGEGNKFTAAASKKALHAQTAALSVRGVDVTATDAESEGANDV